MPVILTTTPRAVTKQMWNRFAALAPWQILAALLLLFPTLSCAQAAPQAKEREPLGSLTNIGEVYVNDSPAPVEITIFSGDRVRVGVNGSATFNMSGKGSLKLSPRSQVLFAGKYEYTAELEAGAVVMNSISGPNRLTLRVGNDVLVPSTKEHLALASADRAPDGPYLVTCSDGAIGVLSLLGTAGAVFLVGTPVEAGPKANL